ncbi:MAG: ATP-binding protein, partial [Gammaproteobacteria bacterium]|nr:ATP-binding protein [Gammaproteobacteria bacterium]
MAVTMEREALKAQWVVPLAFVFILLMITTSIVISFNTIATMHQSMGRVVDEYSTESELVQSLQVVIQQRMTLIRELLLEDDAFQRDEKFQALNILGGRYNAIVAELAQLELKPQARQHLKEMEQYVRDGIELRRSVHESVFEPAHVDRDYILNLSTDITEKHQYSLAALQVLFKSEMDKVWLQTDLRYKSWLRYLWIFTAIILITSIYVAYWTSRYIQQNNFHLTSTAREKAMLLATMSHEIRTPLTSVIGFSETLLDTDSTKEERIAGINAIVRNSRHLQQVINDVLDYSKLDAKQVVLHEARVELRELINDLCGLLKPRAESKGLEFVIQSNGSLPEYISTDEIKFKQILVNLAGNAIKFTEQGKIELRLEFLDEISMLQIEIIDSGIGMDSEQLLHIFEPYRQVKNSGAMGTGLGLYISQQTVNIMGGMLTVESEPGVGS